MRRVSPTFSVEPEPRVEVMLGESRNLTCVAVGSPMPFVKWRRGQATDLTPEDQIPVGKNVLELQNIQESANYTCIAASALGVIERTTELVVKCKFFLTFATRWRYIKVYPSGINFLKLEDSIYIFFPVCCVWLWAYWISSVFRLVEIFIKFFFFIPFSEVYLFKRSNFNSMDLLL